MTGQKPAGRPDDAQEGASLRPGKPQVSITFRPDKSGLEKFMGRLEAEVMKIIWTGGPMTVKRALYFINKEHKYAYTTIMTVMVRLHEKGLLDRRKEGASYVYTPSMDEKSFLKFAVESVMGGLMDEYRTLTTNLFHRVRKSSKKSAE
ncbi:MAG: BlaI/MecI/CopY family transcriptional regulator [Candidatus Zixiibacteriota bacterium]